MTPPNSQTPEADVMSNFLSWLGFNVCNHKWNTHHKVFVESYFKDYYVYYQQCEALQTTAEDKD